MKDFYDVWLLSRQFDFDGVALAVAVRKTFATRDSAVPAAPAAFSGAFGRDPAKATQWKAFVRKSRLGNAPSSFAEAVSGVASFLGPMAKALAQGPPYEGAWKAGGSWTRQDG
ncbi:MAG TPA: nucleotidyl transferase AbiEii/AbiGii toxin family protein [Planctomycetota bacterium]|nr:nucleotidyl transferase AbiEii/AbiGii toxin family protein [Planctomycetota bacterium]